MRLPSHIMGRTSRARGQHTARLIGAQITGQEHLQSIMASMSEADRETFADAVIPYLRFEPDWDALERLS